MTNVLIVGGTGLTGAHAAHYLSSLGMNITLMARNAPSADALTQYPLLLADYTQCEFLNGELNGYDCIVFAAGADIRLYDGKEDEAAFYTRLNSIGIPKFATAVKQAGVPVFVYIGTYYPIVAPAAIETSAYVKSRHVAEQNLLALSSDGFRVCSLCAPFILGFAEGAKLDHLKALVDYAAGRIPDLPVFAPEGGVNHISAQAVSEAIHGAIQRGESGRRYLLGGENISWKQYLECFFASAGRPISLPVRDDEHPLFPDIIMYAGRGATVAYEVDAGELGYCQGDISAVINDVVEAFL